MLCRVDVSVLLVSGLLASLAACDGIPPPTPGRPEPVDTSTPAPTPEQPDAGLPPATPPPPSGNTPPAADLPVTQFTIPGAYRGDGGGGDGCTGDMYDIVGFSPSAAADGETGQKYPVYFYMTGTGGPFSASTILDTAQAVARRGFVAVSVEYNNGFTSFPTGCAGFSNRARCLYEGPTSALGVVCARPDADCGRGVVTHGLSQGANLAILGATFDPRVRASLADSPSDRIAGRDYGACLASGQRALPDARLRLTGGESDRTVSDGTVEFARGIGNRLLSQNCTQNNCLLPDGSGFYITADSEVGDGSADHCWMFNNGCGAGGFDPMYASGDLPWSRKPALNWLLGNVPPVAVR